MTQIFKFDTTTDPIQMFELHDGTFEQDILKKNQLLSYDATAHTVTLTTRFDSYIKTRVFVQTPDQTDDASYFQRSTITFTTLDGKVINDPSSEDDGNIPGDQDNDGNDDDFVGGTGGKDVLHGGGGDDHMSGGAGADILHGDSGNDDLLGGAGKDVLDGGAGDDALVGDGGDDILDGGTGDDILDGSAGNDKLFGGDGNDDLVGGLNADMLDGGAGTDHLVGDAGDDRLFGGDGADSLTGGGGGDALNGGAGDDALAGGDGNDVVRGDDGADTAHGGLGDDKVVGNLGNDTLFGDEGDDALDGGEGNDVLLGGLGKDKLAGGKGDDLFQAGEDAGNDAFAGGDGIDTVDYSAALAGMTVDLGIGIANATSGDSGTGIDKLAGIENAIGSAFADVLIGSKGANVLSGGDGDDRISGGKGADTLAGGAGADVFAYAEVKDSAPGKVDHITDFTSGTDRIDLSAIDAVKGGADNAFTFADSAPASGSAAGVVWFDAAAHTLYASVNADAAPELAIVLDGVTALTAADLVL